MGVTATNEIVGDAESSSASFNFTLNKEKYRKLVIPNAPHAVVMGVSPTGDALVGVYFLTPGVESGFLYQNKTLQTLQFPGSESTEPAGVNDDGDVVGWFHDSTGIQHGFLWTPPADAAKK
jgi:probable HAF family extracellular repeat protein